MPEVNENRYWSPDLDTAKRVAHMWLDFQMNPLTQMVHGDPDCDAVVLARQFIRARETIERLESAITRYLADDFHCNGGAEQMFAEALNPK